MLEKNKTPIMVAQETGGAPGETHATVGHESGEHEGANPLTHHSPWQYSMTALVIALVLVIVGWLGTRRMAKIPGRGMQNFVEFVVEQLNNFCETAIGPGGKRFTPLIGTLFLFILTSNLLGALPLTWVNEGPGKVGPFLLVGPTANLSFNIAMALIVFVTFNVVALKEQGLKGRIQHLAGPIPWMAPLIFVLEVISELIRPLSLSLRLFGNIFGEEMMVAAIIGMVSLIPFIGWVPLHAPIVIFGILTALVQAAVFCLLSCIYLRLAMPAHGDHGDHAADHGGPAMSDHDGHAAPAAAH